MWYIVNTQFTSQNQMRKRKTYSNSGIQKVYNTPKRLLKVLQHLPVLHWPMIVREYNGPRSNKKNMFLFPDITIVVIMFEVTVVAEVWGIQILQL